MDTTCESGAPLGQKRARDPLELELQVIVSYLLGSKFFVSLVFCFIFLTGD